MTVESSSSRSRRLFGAWVLLVGLTMVSLIAALGFGQVEGGRVAAAVALVAAYLKGRAVLDHFMDLRRAGPSWRGIFSGMLLVILGGLMATFLVGHNP